ncbi:hypothetical protein FQA39_LY05021 [Lamprigera yunnana]|nr:hypothetical protein FQA39_LY05021 [Lamprigera yunnana]
MTETTKEQEKIVQQPINDDTSYLDELKDEELVKLVTDLEIEAHHLRIENQIFENYLKKNAPFLLQGMVQILELANRVQNQVQSSLTLSVSSDRRDTTDSYRGTSSRKTDSVSKFATSVSTSERGAR